MRTMIMAAMMSLLTISAHAAETRSLCGFTVADSKVSDFAEPIDVKEATKILQDDGAVQIVVCAGEMDKENHDIPLALVGTDGSQKAISALVLPIMNIAK